MSRVGSAGPGKGGKGKEFTVCVMVYEVCVHSRYGFSIGGGMEWGFLHRIEVYVLLLRESYLIDCLTSYVFIIW